MDIKNINSYRPISVTNNVSRIFEKIIANRLTEYLENNNLLSPNQHGFRKNKSTLSNLVDTYDYVTTQLEMKNSVDIIYLDFEKAFDKVDKILLINKLLSMKIPSYLILWIDRFLTDRTQYVKIRNSVSSTCDVPSGVPQGSVIGPLLFTIYINDLLSDSFNGKIISFADDTKLLNLTKNFIQTQLDLNKIEKWSKLNNIPINLKKSVVMHYGAENEFASYSLCGCALKSVALVKDLGILVDNRLKFAEHCAEIARKCNFVSYSIFKLFHKRSANEYFNLFKMYVRPILEYNISFWYPNYSKYSKLLEGVQKRFTKRILSPELDYSQRLKFLKDSSIHDRFCKYSCHLVFRSIHGILKTEHCFCPSKLSTTRGNSCKLFLPFARTTIRKCYCTIRCIKFWNSLPVSIVSSPNFHSFKRALVSHTLELRA